MVSISNWIRKLCRERDVAAMELGKVRETYSLGH